MVSNSTRLRAAPRHERYQETARRLHVAIAGFLAVYVHNSRDSEHMLMHITKRRFLHLVSLPGHLLQIWHLVS